MIDDLEAAKRGNLGQALLRTARLFDERAFARFARKYPEVRRAHLRLLPHMDMDGTRITEVARRADVTKQAVGQLVTDLETSGMVERRPDPTDQRAKMVVFTRRGRRVMVEGLKIFKAVEEELADEIGAQAVEELARSLALVLPALERSR